MGTFWMNPLRSLVKCWRSVHKVPRGYFVKEPPEFFHKIPSNLIKMCPVDTLRVLWGFVVKLSHIESLLWVLYKEPTGHIVIKSLGILWKNSGGTFTKYPLGTFTKYPLGTLWTLRQHFTKERSGFIQKVPIGYCAGHFLKVPTAYLLGMSWANWHALFKNDQDLPAGYFAGQIGGYFSKVPCWVWAGGIGGYFLKAFTTYLLALGADPYLPRGLIESFLRFFKHFALKIPRGKVWVF